ncbi:K Homology domain, type 1, partial [Dillenia turbinata]
LDISKNMMSTKVDQASTVDSRPSPSTSTKISKFAAKSGFVIPKNKLSGSLVPIIRGSTKSGVGDASKDEGANQVQRKTKWGPDLTQDASVRRGRALAYQARVDQITQQLKSGTLEIDDHKGFPLTTQSSGQETSSQLKNNMSLELLQLERREAIGEILKLNPYYKAPPDYKPLLKEAKVPVPLKEYPGYNFIGLIFGPGGDTLRRVEKETGAKIHVYGIKADEREKVEISISDGFEMQDKLEEIYIHVLADTYGKADAAVALMELLVNPISGVPAVPKTTASVSGITVLNPSQDTLTPDTISSAAVNQGHIQPPQSELQPYPRPWFPGGPSNTLLHGPSSFGPAQNPSASILIPPGNLSSPLLNPSNMPSLFGPRPSSVYGFSPVPQSTSVLPPRSQPPLQVQHPFAPPQPLVHPTAPRNISMLGPMPSPFLLNNPTLPSVMGNHVIPTGPPSMPSVPQLMPFPPSIPPPNLPLPPNANSTGWSGGASGPPASLGPSNMVIAPPQGSTPAISQPIEIPAAPLSGLSAANTVPSVTFSPVSSAPRLSNHPTGAPNFPSVPLPLPGAPSMSTSFFSAPVSVPAVTPVLNQPSPTGQVQLVTPRMLAPSSSSNPLLGSGIVPTSSQPPPPSHPGNSANVPGFSPIKPPPVATPRPGDFTFQPHQQQSPAAQMVPRSSNQPAVPNTVPSNPAVQPPLAPQAPSFQFGVHNAASRPTVQLFPRPPFSNQMGQPQHQASTNMFPGTPSAISGSPRPPMFPNPSAHAPQNPVQQLGPRNFAPALQLPNLPPRPGNPLQLQQSHPAPAGRPGNFLLPTQQFRPSGTFASSPGGHQVYDPFSPTSVSVAPQRQGEKLANARNPENDPEYEDLMASVGVR